MTPDPNNDLLWAMPVPEGEVRTPVNPPSNDQGLMACGIATTVIAVVCVISRIYTRAVIVRNFGIDDYLVTVAMVLACVYSGITLYSLDLGAGNHLWDIPADKFTTFMLFQLVITIFYSTAVSFSKLSILTFYLRLSPETSFRWAVYVLIGLVCAYTLAYEFISVFQCNPIKKFWMPAIDGTCIGRMIPMMTLSVANALIDTIILVIPIRVVLPLKIPRRQKISLIFLFATGGFVCAATIQRTVILPGLLVSNDYTWEVTPQMVWGFIEINAGLVCASVPALKPLFMRYLPFIIASSFRSSQDRDGSHSHGHGHGHKLGSMSNTYAKDRSKMAVQSYELPSRDDLTERTKYDDDQAKLWSRGNSSCQAGGGLKKKTTKGDSDDNSMDSFEQQYMGRSGGQTTASAWGPKSVSLKKGINVTKETRISYDMARK